MASEINHKKNVKKIPKPRNRSQSLADSEASTNNPNIGLVQQSNFPKPKFLFLSQGTSSPRNRNILYLNTSDAFFL